jgi:RNA polymerase sigma-70 factor (ECF subfamily)
MSHNERDDSDLIAAFVARKDEAAFRALYRRYTPRLYAIALRLCGGRSADAEDVLQETWIRAARLMHGYRGESSLRTWLTGIALHCIQEMRRRSGREEPLAPPQEPVHAGAPSIDIDRCLARLPEGYRAVLTLHELEGHTHEEIGEMLGIEPGTSKSQLSRARAAMRALLEGGRA